ncbi:FtsX-like permease family protein [Patescibacteria group bacterium]|nr:FtsX-like permease family protein [Patescibacteria group bacterium]
MQLPKYLKVAARALYQFLKYILTDFFSFNVLVFFYVLDMVLVNRLARIRFKFLPYKLTSRVVGLFYKTYSAVSARLDKSRSGSISKLDLIQLAIRNMKVKKVRTLITIGGVSIGIGAIVFLVSLGYGFQRLVISRVARLDELKQADVLTQPGSKVLINDKTLADVGSFSDVDAVYPLIAAVGRINYQNSISDMAVYGVTTGYLEKSAIKPVQGKVFDSNETAFKPSTVIPVAQVQETTQEVKGASTSRKEGSYGQLLASINFNIEPDTWIRVRSAPSTSADILGYTKRAGSVQNGDTYFGGAYEDTEYGNSGLGPDGNSLGIWIKSKIYLWTQVGTEYEPILDEQGNQEQIEGYFANIGILEQSAVFGYSPSTTTGEVLGDSTSSIVVMPEVLAEEDAQVEDAAKAPASDDPLSAVEIDPNSEWVDLNEEESVKDQVSKVLLSSEAVKQAVVNRAMLKLLGITEDQAVGKTFSTSFVVPSYLLEDPSQRVESEPAEYTIVGVTPDDNTPVFYVPFVDLRSLGIVNFSQFKVSVLNATMLDKVRKQVEAIGYTTQSVADTVEQINSLFATIRLVLGIMGMIALAVAALGMFNTLTVSLLERSREVGLMKAMGMTTKEVQELFLTESIIMGFCAGVGGLLAGFVSGKLLGLVLTFLSIFKGQGYLDVSEIPFSFVALIMFLSLVVGLVTGVYPAKRSKKISALDALRYE